MSNIISIFDTSIASYNIGNQIIMDAVILELNELFSDSFIVKLPVEDIKTNARKYNTKSDISFVGGTNILNSDIRHYRQWDLSFHNVYMLSNIVLMGCGWFQYENRNITSYTKWAFNRILSKNYIHSVRDNYTKEKLATIGIRAINTGCPTLWRLTPEVVNRISKSKREEVVITLTDYNRDINRDKILLETCLKEYKKVYYFPQGTGDVEYLKSLGFLEKIIMLAPRLDAYNKILDSHKVDYVGTRLHAGIRALQKSVRTCIIGIDNRALEMHGDFNIPVLNQNKISELSQYINQDYQLNLNIPFETIKEWKKQFMC